MAISLVRGEISVVEAGITNGEGVSGTESDEEASGESPPVEHAHRIMPQKRSIRKIFCIEVSKSPNPCTRILVSHLVDVIFPRNVPNAECQLFGRPFS